jgi:hypothetical protein
MKTLFRAVISGFGFSLGAALYKKVSKRLGMDDESNDRLRQQQPGDQPSANSDADADADADRGDQA